MDSPANKRPFPGNGEGSAKKKCTTPSIMNYFSPRPRTPQTTVTELHATDRTKPLKLNQITSVLTPPKTQPSLGSQTPKASPVINADKRLLATPQRGSPNAPRVTPIPQTSESDDRNFAHHNYQFLHPEYRCDINGNRPSDPNYDDKTLSVPRSFLDTQTPALRQWWIIKQKNMDAILMFKMGKFYELFNEDAVTGVNELDIIFMKGEEGKPAHAGFPEVSYSKYASILINKGYRVLRIEQTETPAMMEERIQRTGQKGKFDRVVQREICQATTKGTQMMSVSDSVFHSAQNQYLLAVCESTGDRKLKTYGICFTDVTTSKLYVGQFVDDNNLSNLNILLAHHTPVEILYERGNLSQDAYQAIVKTGARLTPLRPNKEFWQVKKAISHLKTNHIYTDETGRCKWPQTLKTMFEEGEESQDILSLEPRDDYKLALNSFGAIVYYLNTQLIVKQVLKCTSFELYETPLRNQANRQGVVGNSKQAPPMVMDHVALKNLEIFVNSSGTSEATLFASINHCKTHFGQRLLKNWLCSPLCAVQQIENRLDAVETLMSNKSGSLMNEVTHILGQVPDLERILSKIKNQCYKSESDSRAIMFDGDQHSKAKITSFLNLLGTFKKLYKFIGSMSKSVKNLDSRVLRRLLSFTDEDGLYPDYGETLKYFESSFDHTIAQQTGKIIPNHGVDSEYDSCEVSIRNLKDNLDDYLEEQKSVLKCKQLEFFGSAKARYQIQVPESHLKYVPDEYRIETARKGYKRFYTPTIDKYFSELTCHEEKMKKILDSIMSKIFEQFMSKISLWSAAIECIAILDVLQSIAYFARTLKANNIDLCRPQFVQDRAEPLVEYKDGRHPTLVKSNANYIPNDLRLDDKLILLSGANMGGKSTIMRQTAMMVVLAQIGCFVPASSLRLTPVDRIFSRMGASDRLLDGESTFYTELVETSAILSCATRDSLLLLDELGRGTSTFDGTAIAYSVIKEISSGIRCRCLFSTHYHTLSRDFQDSTNIRLAHMACKVEAEDDHKEIDADPLKETITFLYKITDGPAAKSYGFNVAKLAGIPETIIREAFKKSCHTSSIAV